MTIRVLLVDDHKVVCDGLHALLQTEEDIAVVGAAGNGYEAVQQAARLQPDVVIMGIAMPEMNGIEATEQIAKLKPAPRVLILTMHADADLIYRALQAGAQGYLLKEASGAELVDALRTVYAGQRYLSQRVSTLLANAYVCLRGACGCQSLLEVLSPSERQVLQLVVEGKSSAEIAERLSLSVKTIETYRSRLMHKLGITDLPGLIRFAIRHGLTMPE